MTSLNYYLDKHPLGWCVKESHDHNTIVFVNEDYSECVNWIIVKEIS